MTFELNGKSYITDAETLNLLRQYRDAANTQMFGIVFESGLVLGRIKAA